MPSIKILIINPNISAHMTDALKPIIDGLHYPSDIQFDYFTAHTTTTKLPDGREISGLPSINSGADSIQSALHVRPHIEALVSASDYDGFLVACFSAHPLVGMIKDMIRRHDKKRVYVTGIFEVGVSTALTLASSFQITDDQTTTQEENSSWGIVTTGKIWETELTTAVAQMFGIAENTTATNGRFAGVESTGLTAIELHEVPADEVRRRITAATVRLLSRSSSRPVRAVCLGCAGMAGMEEAVRQGCVEAYGEEGKDVFIVDGVVAGIAFLVNACRAGF
ncbi:hypothetical protein VTN31DRAFT_914 [Thermomyces dupontii]|uniref:uncharacterized protein n=1 Tax=Talaromyces thermophilus TaxID=28565 RepID=UPI0037429998